VRLAWLGEDESAWGDDMLLVAVEEIPGATELKGYFELFMKVTRTTIGGGRAGNDFERAEVR
jgi:hypothetical protein